MFPGQTVPTMKSRLIRVVAAFVLGLSSTCSFAVANEPIPLRAFLSPAKYSAETLSSDGRYLAVLTPINGKRNLAVIDLQTRKSQAVTSIKDFDILRFWWIGNGRLAFTVGRLGAPTGPDAADGGGLFVVSRDGKESRTITPTRRERTATAGGAYQAARGLSFFQSIAGSDDEFIASGNLRSIDSEDLYRVNAVTGKQTLLTFEHPGKVMEWILDHHLVPRVAVVADKDDDALERDAKVLYREAAGSPWQEIASMPLRTGDIYAPLNFDADNKTLFFASNRDRDTTAIYRFDPTTRVLGSLVGGHPRYDMGRDAAGSEVPGLIQDPQTGELLGIRVDAESSQITWINDDWAKVQAQMEASFPAKEVSIQRRRNGRTLVKVSADTSVPRSYLYDEAAKRLEELVASTDLLKDGELQPLHSFLLRTRDGLEIPSYYVLPKTAKPGDRLPTVVHIHGGPHARADYGGYMQTFGVREAQILASRGYAVILPNHRVTPGLGRRIYMAGFGAVGTRMSEDHEDAVKWAIAQGISDPRRICITGASYGGYATLQALIKTPDMFACGIAGLSVSDYELQLTSMAGDTADSKAGVAYWRRLLGLGKGDSWDKARSVSPAYNVARIKAPLAMYAGRADVRTPLEQTERVVNEMKKLGNAPEYVFIADGEGHGFGKIDNNLKSYELMLNFLDRHIGAQSPFAVKP